MECWFVLLMPHLHNSTACIYPVRGCTDSASQINYDPAAEEDDGWFADFIGCKGLQRKQIVVRTSKLFLEEVG